MKRVSNINEFWGAVIRRDMSSYVREEDKFHSKEELEEYLKKEIGKQGKNVVIKNLDVSGIEDLSFLFGGLLDDGVETLDLSGWNTKGVKNMRGMFAYCKNLESLDLSGWNTISVTNMSYMFGNCSKLASLDLSGWNIEKVTDMSWMFNSCEDLQSLDLSGWNTSNVINMKGAFQNCKQLKSLDLSGWNTSSVTNMGWMFENCPAPYKVVDKKIVKI